MRPFRWPVIGELWAAGMVPPAFRFLMKLQGIGDFSQVSKAEINTYHTLMKGDDRGRAFLRVSRSSRRTSTTGPQANAATSGSRGGWSRRPERPSGTSRAAGLTAC